jgi:hypothetical protein
MPIDSSKLAASATETLRFAGRVYDQTTSVSSAAPTSWQHLFRIKP